MSALTDLFSAMANKIRSKTGTATTYTPPQMVSDGIDDVFDAGVASATTPITPSNSSPVAMAANTGYKPTTGGYAVETVQTITPTYGVEDTVQSGAIIRFGGSGVITKEIPTPSELTPSNSSPATITNGGLYSATGNGYAIASYSSKTPSDTSPASVTSGSIIKPSSNGYLYKTQQTHVLPEFTATANKKDDKCYAKIGIDCTKYKTLQFTLSMNNASFSNSNEYLRIYSNGSSVYSLSTSMSTQIVTLQSSWGSDASINIFGHGTAAYGSITLSNIQLTPR